MVRESVQGSEVGGQGRTLRDECRVVGIPWADVRAAAQELRGMEIAKRECFNGARRRAWELYCHFAGRSAGCEPFWRCGFDHVLGRLANRGYDYTAVTAYDVIAEAVAEDFSEWAGRCDELWEFLAEPYEPLPRTEQFVERAIEWVSGERGQGPEVGGQGVQGEEF